MIVPPYDRRGVRSWGYRSRELSVSISTRVARKCAAQGVTSRVTTRTEKDQQAVASPRSNRDAPRLRWCAPNAVAATQLRWGFANVGGVR